MTSTHLQDRIAILQDMRERAAALATTLAERELEGRQLRASLEAEKRQAGSTKTDAEKDAKVDPKYLEHERRTLQVRLDYDVLLARAEAQRFNVQLGLVELQETVLIEEAV